MGKFGLLGNLFKVKNSPFARSVAGTWNSGLSGKLGVGATLGVGGLAASAGIRSLHDHGGAMADYVSTGLTDTAVDAWRGARDGITDMVADDWKHFSKYNQNHILKDIYANPYSGWGNFANGAWEKGTELPGKLWSGVSGLSSAAGKGILDSFRHATWQ